MGTVGGILPCFYIAGTIEWKVGDERMLLVFDVGNTNITIGLFDGETLIALAISFNL